MKTLQSILYVLVMILAMRIMFVLGTHSPQTSIVGTIIEKVDTLTIHDTITAYKPTYIKKHKIDSVLVPVGDTVTLHDTLYVYLEREQVVWQDSLARVYASGILPQVDSVQHFISEKIITIDRNIPVKIHPKWGLGVGIGGVVTIDNGLMVVKPGIEFGIHRNILTW